MLSLRIALRYLLWRKRHAAVNVISAVSIAGVAVATAAIVVVLSVFNGFTRLSETHLSRIDPLLRVVPTAGKIIPDADSLCSLIAAIDGVEAALPTLVERGLLDAGAGGQVPVHVKGVAPQFNVLAARQDLMLDGEAVDDMAQISVGVAMQTGLRPFADTYLTIYMPRRVGKINPTNHATAFRSTNLQLSGVFRVDSPQYDADYVLVPIDRLRQMLSYDSGEASSIEITAPVTAMPAIRKQLQTILPKHLDVQTRLQQQADAFRMISIEKWVTFLMLVFILVVASFNIISTLSLLIIEKRDNMLTLRSLGADRSSIRHIFMWQGALITLAGGFAGIVLGVVLSLIQQHFGLIKLAGDPSTLNTAVYPVALEPLDTLVVAAAIVLVAAAAALITRAFKTS